VIAQVQNLDLSAEAADLVKISKGKRSTVIIARATPTKTPSTSTKNSKTVISRTLGCSDLHLISVALDARLDLNEPMGSHARRLSLVQAKELA
jgi:hypothetical protein